MHISKSLLFVLLQITEAKPSVEEDLISAAATV
jgi:hypothetical protein